MKAITTKNGIAENQLVTTIAENPTSLNISELPKGRNLTLADERVRKNHTSENQLVIKVRNSTLENESVTGFPVLAVNQLVISFLI